MHFQYICIINVRDYYTKSITEYWTKYFNEYPEKIVKTSLDPTGIQYINSCINQQINAAIAKHEESMKIIKPTSLVNRDISGADLKDIEEFIKINSESLVGQDLSETDLSSLDEEERRAK